MELRWAYLSLSKTHTLKEAFLSFKDKTMVVFWHGRVLPSIPRDDFQPKIEIYLKEILPEPEEKVGESVFITKVGIADAGLLPVGSLWYRGSRVGDLDVLEEELFTTSFNNQEITLLDLKDVDGLIDNALYKFPPLPPERVIHRSKILSLPILGSPHKKIIIPCTEVFNRLYGHGAELRRIIMTYEWDEVINRCLGEVPISAPDDYWVIKVGGKMQNPDSVILAHMAFDSYAQKAIKDIRKKVHLAFGPKGSNPSEIEATPWFQGIVQLKLKGLWISSSTFLGLRILGSTQPEGKPIVRIKESGAVKGIDKNNQNSEEQKLPRAVMQDSGEVELINHMPPDRNAPLSTVEEEPFMVLGSPREVKMLIEKAHEGKIYVAGEPRVSQFSTGERSGTGKGIGKAIARTPIEFQSFGTLKDLWAEFIQLRQEGEICNVHYIAGDKVGFTEPLKLEPFVPIPLNEELKFELGVSRSGKSESVRRRLKEKEIRNWVYYDKRSAVLRGALISSITTKAFNTVYFVEIQRKKKYSKKEEKIVEEAFKGIAFILDDDAIVNQVLNAIMHHLVRNQGVMRVDPQDFPGKLITYKHAKVNEKRFYKKLVMRVIKELEAWK